MTATMLTTIAEIEIGATFTVPMDGDDVIYLRRHNGVVSIDANGGESCVIPLAEFEDTQLRLRRPSEPTRFYASWRS